MRFFLAACLLIPAVIQSQEVDASDILFLKVQELEAEIFALRSEFETQAYLIDKLLSENEALPSKNTQANPEPSIPDNRFRFKGINDSQSIDEVYAQAISALNNCCDRLFIFNKRDYGPGVEAVVHFSSSRRSCSSSFSIPERGNMPLSDLVEATD